MVKLVVEIESFGMSFDEFDKETGSSNGLQPKQADLNCVHALNELHLHETRVVPIIYGSDRHFRVPNKFSVGDYVLLKVSPWKDLHEKLDGVHDTFYVSNLKKCLADPTLQVPLDEIQVDAKLNFIEEPVEILEREFKKLKRSRIAIVKVRWNLKRGPEFTWEREDHMKLKYPHFLVMLVVEFWGRNSFKGVECNLYPFVF
ncbi:hypothetical protein Tco_0865682 [Tanacetum coccineum]